MASIRVIKRRIRSAKNIAQITKAMEMVAASKMKKAQDAALLGKVYADKIYQATKELALRVDRRNHPLLSLGSTTGKKLVIVISTNKGLCGGLNSNLFRELQKVFGKESAIDFVSVGKKGQSFIVRTGKKLVADFSETVPFYQSVSAVSSLLVSGFLNGTYNEVFLVYSDFINALKQQPKIKQILPLQGITHDQIGDGASQENEELNFSEFLIEPSESEVLDSLIPHYLENQVRSAIFEAEASEHSARMMAMKNATDAALDLMDSLTLAFNKIRQEKITFEIADMVTARMAVS